LRAVTPPLRQREALHITRHFIRGLQTHNAFQAAASIAFWFFLSLVPLLVLVGFLVGSIARTKGVDALLAPLLDVVPTTAEDIVRKELERLAGGAASSLAPLGVAGFLWTASSGLHNLMDVFESKGDVKPRPWWKKRLISLGWVVVGLAAVCVLTWILVQVDGLFHQPMAAKVHGLLRRHARKHFDRPLEQVTAALLMFVVGGSLLAGFYRFAVEHPAGTRRSVWPGTFAAIVGWLVVSWAFGGYVASIADYALYYGSLAAVAVMLVWLYLTSLALVAGAEVNAQFESMHRKRAAGGARD
jgi:membrane protein